MPALMLLIETIGAPVAAGRLGGSVVLVLLVALVVSAANVATGWRAGSAGPVPSVVVGYVFSLIVALPVFYLTAWLSGHL
jgi:hypothetical protein